jgi:acetolactate synthase regulatory subunit
MKLKISIKPLSLNRLMKELYMMVMSVQTKLDTLDFIINMLLKHERQLDLLIDRLEKHIDMIDNIIKKEKLINIM